MSKKNLAIILIGSLLIVLGIWDFVSAANCASAAGCGFFGSGVLGALGFLGLLFVLVGIRNIRYAKSIGANQKPSVEVATRPDGTKEMHTTNPSMSVDILFGELLSSVPEISKDDVLIQYRSVQQTWACNQLFTGDSEKMKKVILINLREFAANGNFEKFIITTFDRQQCAQVMAIFSTGVFKGVRVWRTNAEMYVCGNPPFHE